mmetsp:Transcript_5911/g.5066  ORF Transcript_5911/g.5066 Transcript_5911/m.5066 type:complete len:301 (+) Transcript_5911:107-1009(+)
MPLLAFIIMFRYRNDLENETLRKYLLVLYQGLRPSVFYWEIVNTFRKFIILAFNVFLSTYSAYYRILGAIISLIILLRVQERLQPYKKEENNRIEMLAILSGIVTLYCALVFVVEEESISIIYNLSLAILFIINMYFILNWLHLLLMSLNYEHRYFKILIKYYSIMICKRSKIESMKIPEKSKDIRPPTKENHTVNKEQSEVEVEVGAGFKTPYKKKHKRKVKILRKAKRRQNRKINIEEPIDMFQISRRKVKEEDISNIVQEISQEDDWTTLRMLKSKRDNDATFNEYRPSSNKMQKYL